MQIVRLSQWVSRHKKVKLELRENRISVTSSNVFLRQLLYRSEDSIRATSAKCRMKREVVHQMSSDILEYMNRHRSRYS